MKFLVFSFFTIVSPNFLHAQYIPSYVESSQGLETPALEGGRTELDLADINSDGYLDILSVGDHGSPLIGTQEHGIMVWFGDGTGNWSVYQYGDFGYGGIAVGDVNNDGLLDVGYGIHHDYSANDLGDQIIEVALGDGTGTFWTAWDDGLATHGETYGMFGADFADIDCDGDLDLGVNSFGYNAGIHVYENEGDGSWTQIFGFVGGNSTDDFVFGDLNNDGFPDFAAAHQNGMAYLNDGTGDFTLADGNLPPGGLLGRRGPELGDINSDGNDELAFANPSGGVEVWMWSEGNVWTSVSNGLPVSGGYDAAQMTDMNMDGFADIAAFGSGLVTIWLGDGISSWNQSTQFSLPSPGDFQAFRIDGDADHNGFPDIALVDEEQNGFNYRNHLRFFKESSPGDTLSISGVHPGPGRRWNSGSVQTIRWISEVSPGDSSWVGLEISLSDTSGPWQTIALGLPNNGHFQWTVPDSLASSDQCRIRYSVHTQAESTSVVSQAFSIIGAPVNVNPDAAKNHDHPLEFSLFQNYPNPFNPTTTFSFSIPASLASADAFSEAGPAGGRSSVFANLSMYDILGRRVATLVNEMLASGRYTRQWDASGMPSGVYFYQLKAGGFITTKSMLLIK